MSSMVTILTQSMLLAIMGIGVYITYKILDFPDMTADGSYTLGAAITTAMLTAGWNPFLAILASILGGALAGMTSGLLHVKLKITNLLSGILVMGMLYSINLRVMGGKSNLAIFEANHLLNRDPIGGLDSSVQALLIGLVVVILVKIFLDLLLKTGLGYLIKGTGDNEQMIKTLGVSVDRIKVIALMVSNGIISLSGSMMSQFLGFADVNMGIGSLVLGIASIIVGLSVFQKVRFLQNTSKIILGTVIYQFAVYLALNSGLQSSDLKLITALIIIVFISLSQTKIGARKFGQGKGKKQEQTLILDQTK